MVMTGVIKSKFPKVTQLAQLSMVNEEFCKVRVLIVRCLKVLQYRDDVIIGYRRKKARSPCQTLTSRSESGKINVT